MSKALGFRALSGLFGWSEGLAVESFSVNYDDPVEVFLLSAGIRAQDLDLVDVPPCFC